MISKPPPEIRSAMHRPDVGPTIWEIDGVLYAECAPGEEPDVYAALPGRLAEFPVKRLFISRPG